MKITPINELTQEEILNAVDIWNRKCKGCQNIECNNDWREILTCQGVNRINRERKCKTD